MKYLLSTIVLAGCVLASGPLAAADESEAIGTVESEGNAVERFFYSVWSGIRALSPRTEVAAGDTRVVATAGLRGAEGDNDGIEPYWKGDLANDPAFVARVEGYRDAIEQARAGDPAPLEDWLGDNGESDLAANAQLALAVTYAGSSKTAAAREALQAFMSDYPEHPLMPQARQLRQRL